MRLNQAAVEGTPVKSARHSSIRPLLRYFLIAAIFLLGGIFRLRHIDQPLVDSFNWREASTAMMAESFSRGNWNILYPEVSWCGPGPSYPGREFQTLTYLVALLYRVFGLHEWIGRSVAAIFGLVCLWVFYLLVGRVWDESHARLMPWLPLRSRPSCRAPPLSTAPSCRIPRCWH